MRSMWNTKQNNTQKTYATDMFSFVRPDYALISEEICDHAGKLGQVDKGRLRC